MQRYITNCLREKIRQHNAKQEDVKRFLLELNQRVQDRLNQLMIEEMHLKSIMRMQIMEAERQEQESTNLSNAERKMARGPEVPNKPAGEPLQEELNLGVDNWHCDFFSDEEEEEDDDEDMEEAAKETIQTDQLDCASDDEHLDSFPPNIRTEALQVMHQLLKRHDERVNQSTDSMDEEPEETSQAFQNLVSSESESSDQEMPEGEQHNRVLLNKQEANAVPEVDTDKENE